MPTFEVGTMFRCVICRDSLEGHIEKILLPVYHYLRLYECCEDTLLMIQGT